MKGPFWHGYRVPARLAAQEYSTRCTLVTAKANVVNVYEYYLCS